MYKYSCLGLDFSVLQVATRLHPTILADSTENLRSKIYERAN